MSNSCLLEYATAANQLYLYNDAGTAWLTPATVGAAGTLSNSQCSINMAAATVTKSGTNLTLNLPVTFTAAYAGAKTTYMYAGGSIANSGWQTMGSWTVAAISQPPQAVSVSPSSGSGPSQLFSFVFSDPNGYSSIVSTQLDLNTGLSPTHACYLYFAVGSNLIYLATDSGGWQSPITVGQSATLQNSQCLLSGASSSVSGSGTTLTLNLALSFTASYESSQAIWMEAYDGTLDSDGFSAVRGRYRWDRLRR